MIPFPLLYISLQHPNDVERARHDVSMTQSQPGAEPDTAWRKIKLFLNIIIIIKLAGSSFGRAAESHYWEFHCL